MYWFNFLALGLVYYTGTAFADPDYDHRRNFIPGVRAPGLAGAYTALSDGPEGGYYNPAGLAFGDSKHTDVSISVTGISKQHIRFKNIQALKGEDFNETSETFFPGFAGALYRLGPFGLGWSYMTLDARNINQDNKFSGAASQNLELDNYSRTHQETSNFLLAGGSLALGLFDTLSFGFSVYYYSRDVVATNHQVAEFRGGFARIIDQKYTTSNYGIWTVYGGLLDLGFLRFGVSYQKSQGVQDETRLLVDDIVYTGSGRDLTIQKTEPEYPINNEINPSTLRVGLALIFSPTFLVSGDVLLHEAASREDPLLEAFDLVKTINYSLGSELKLSSWIFRGGAFTNFSQHPEVEEGIQSQPTKVDYYGVSMSIGLELDGWEGTVTTTQQSGSGKSQKITQNPDIQDVEATNHTFLIGARYKFK